MAEAGSALDENAQADASRRDTAPPAARGRGAKELGHFLRGQPAARGICHKGAGSRVIRIVDAPRKKQPPERGLHRLFVVVRRIQGAEARADAQSH